MSKHMIVDIHVGFTLAYRQVPGKENPLSSSAAEHRPVGKLVPTL